MKSWETTTQWNGKWRTRERWRVKNGETFVLMDLKHKRHGFVDLSSLVSHCRWIFGILSWTTTATHCSPHCVCCVRAHNVLSTLVLTHNFASNESVCDNDDGSTMPCCFSSHFVCYNIIVNNNNAFESGWISWPLGETKQSPPSTSPSLRVCCVCVRCWMRRMWLCAVQCVHCVRFHLIKLIYSESRHM